MVQMVGSSRAKALIRPRVSSFLLPATDMRAISDLMARAATTRAAAIGLLRWIRAILAMRRASSAVRATSTGTALSAAMAMLCVLSEDLPSSARIARVFDSF